MMNSVLPKVALAAVMTFAAAGCADGDADLEADAADARSDSDSDDSSSKPEPSVDLRATPTACNIALCGGNHNRRLVRV